MKRDKNVKESAKESRQYNGRVANRKCSKQNTGRGRNNSKGSDKITDKTDPRSELDSRNRNNDPNWYFGDRNLAEQTTQLAFQQLAGYSIDTAESVYPVGNVVTIPLSPSAGPMAGKNNYNTLEIQKAGINMAGFKLFSKLSAYTGRSATYAPSDISMMILYMGEVISILEWIRRCFGIANIYSLRNRAYPRAILRALRVDPDDLFTHLSDYRMKFNTLITLLNQVPIPKGIMYFEKCASLYEKLYVDDNSPMAQTIAYTIGLTWELDEKSDPHGTRLVTKEWGVNLGNGNVTDVHTMEYYLNKADSMVQALLNASTFQVVYTDLLNLSVKIGTQFWAFDYLFEGYTVAPEYNENFLLQMHNLTIVGTPFNVNSDELLTSESVTKYNDVVSCPDVNGVFYNPAMPRLNANDAESVPTIPRDIIVDMLTAEPTVEDRIEVMRFTSAAGLRNVALGNVNLSVDNTFPDHWVNGYFIHMTDDTVIPCTHMIYDSAEMTNVLRGTSVIDWAPRFYECSTDKKKFTGNQYGDLNYYTVVDYSYLSKVNNFISLWLYDIH